MPDVTVSLPAQQLTATIPDDVTAATKADIAALAARIAALENGVHSAGVALAAVALGSTPAPSPSPSPSPTPTPTGTVGPWTPLTPAPQSAPLAKIGTNSFPSIMAALAAASPGDTIEVAPAFYQESDPNHNRTGVLIDKAGITLRSMGPGVVIKPLPGVVVQHQKGLLCISAPDITIDGSAGRIEVGNVDQSNGDASIAGIVCEDPCTKATIRFVVVHDCINGFRVVNADLANPADITIEDAEVYASGVLTGCHNLYFNNDNGKLTVTRFASHDPVWGHVLKSRAKSTNVVDSIFQCGSGHIDIPDAGEFQMRGGKIISPLGANDRQTIGYGMESAKNLPGAGALVTGVTFDNQTGIDTHISVGSVPNMLTLQGCTFLGSQPVFDPAKVTLVAA